MIPSDAQLLLEFLRKHPERFRPWVADDVATRQIALLSEHRRQLVDDRTALSNRLTTLLKGYFPQALEWAGDLTAPLAWDFLAQFPSLERAQQASRLEVLKLYRAHTRRTPEQLEALCEQIRTAPPLTTDRAVIESSVLMVQTWVGQLRVVQREWNAWSGSCATCLPPTPTRRSSRASPGPERLWRPACWRLGDPTASALRGPRTCSASPAPPPSPCAAAKVNGCIGAWPVRLFCAKPFMSSLPNRVCGRPGPRPITNKCASAASDHHPAVRSLAFKWIRIMFRCWKDRTLYDEARYQQALKRRGSPLAMALSQLATPPARA